MADSAEIVEASLLPPDDGAGSDPEPPPRRRPPAVVLLAAGLVLALTAGVIGWRSWRDGGLTGGQARAVSAVEQYTSALDTHDLSALRATLAERASFSGGEHLSSPAVGPLSGKELDDFYGSMFRAGVRMTTQGPVQVTGKGPYHVVAVQTVRYTAGGVPVTERGLSLFTVVELSDGPVILEHVWWPSPAAGPRDGYPASAVSGVRGRLSP